MTRPAALPRVLMLVVLLLVMISRVGTAHAAGAPGSRPQRATFGIQPSTAKGPDSRPYLLYPVSAGTTVLDHVAVVNYSPLPLTLRVYATDAFNARNGDFSLLDRKVPATLAGTWLTLAVPGGRAQLTVAPRSFAVVPLTLRAPAGARPGDHVAGVVAALTTRAASGKGTAVELDQRVGIRTFVRISGPLRPRLSIEDVHRSYRGTANPAGTGRTAITYTVHNTGNVSLGGAQNVSAHGLLGPTFASARLQDLPLLIPGGTVTVTATIPHTWPLAWMTARVQITPKIVNGVSSGNVPALQNQGHYLAVPWPLLLIVLGLLGLDQARRWRRRHGSPWSRDGSRGKHAAPRRPASSVPVVTSVSRAGLAGLLLALLTAAPAAADAEQVPYADNNVTGGITLCGVDGKPVLTGKVTDAPFVWKAVGDTAADAEYGAPGRTAFLVAYQPRKGIDPGGWSGFQLNAASTYDNVKHPVAQSTPRSSTLNAFLLRYHPDWDGYVQLRLLLTGSNRQVKRDTYAATDLRVVGDTWHVVRGGNSACSSGAGTSTAALLHVPGTQGTPSPGAVASPPPLVSSPRPQATRSPGEPIVATTAPTEQAASSAPPPAKAHGVLGASLTPVLLIAGAAAVTTGLVTAWAMRRRAR